MISLFNLNGSARRRCMRMLRNIRAHHGCLFVRDEASFRDAERLHRAGLVTAAISKHNWWRGGRRPFRELAIFLDEGAARREYPRTILNRRGR